MSGDVLALIGVTIGGGLLLVLLAINGGGDWLIRDLERLESSGHDRPCSCYICARPQLPKARVVRR